MVNRCAGKTEYKKDANKLKLRIMFGCMAIVMLLAAVILKNSPLFRVFFLLQLLFLGLFWLTGLFESYRQGTIRISYGSDMILKNEKPAAFWAIFSIKGMVGVFVLTALFAFSAFYIKMAQVI